MNNNLLHQVALTLVPNIGPVQARTLVDHFGDAAAVFKAKNLRWNHLKALAQYVHGALKILQRSKRLKKN